jgi:S-adenosylmethionine hydrolase
MVMETPVITLLSDFGLKDPYVSEMKAVMMRICPEAHIIDVSHDIEKCNIQMGAFVLACAAQYFPNGTIHVAVVDPGVGTKRRPILIETSQAFYLGPDNGLLLVAAQKEGVKRVFNITNSHYMRPRVSGTFHGRDIFAPVAAYLASGIDPQDLGPEIQDYVIPRSSKPELTANEIRGEVVHIDDFGNIITNISVKDFEKKRIKPGSKLHLTLKNRIITLKFCSAYNETPVGKPLALIGSHDFIEISINQGNASRRFGTKTGFPVIIMLGKRH